MTMTLPLIPYDDPRLHERCESVEDVAAEAELVAQLKETVSAMPTAIGLAAPQVGVLKRIFVLKLATNAPPAAYINPEMVSVDKAWSSMDEGCLSYPQLTVSVGRPRSITVTYLDEHGSLRDEELTGLACRAFLHELDHLDGVTIFDRVPNHEKPRVLSALKRRTAKRLIKLKKP